MFCKLSHQEKQLEHVLFGTDYNIKKRERNKPFLFEIDKVGSDLLAEHTDCKVKESVDVNDLNNYSKKRAPAWHDEDDENVTVSLTSQDRLLKLKKNELETKISGPEFIKRLRKRFKSSNKNNKWSKNVEEADAASILTWAGALLEHKTKKIAANILEVSRVKDGNVQERSQAVIQALQFHPSSQLLMTAGLDKTIRLYNVDGRVNELIQKMHFNNFPIYSCGFSWDGSKLFCSGRRKFFYVYDLGQQRAVCVPGLQGRKEKSLKSLFVCPVSKNLVFLGASGNLLLVDANSMRLIQTLKMNGTVTSLSLSKDGSYMYSFGGDGEVYVWDLSRRVCIHKFRDEGCLSGTAVANSGRFIACGSRSGIVNIYNSAACMKTATPKPLKSVLNLTTRTEIHAFNHDSQILLMASRAQRDHLKLLHTGSLSVFSNWPTASTPLRHVHASCFSPNSGYLAIGNDRGHALLYRLSHYDVS